MKDDSQFWRGILVYWLTKRIPGTGLLKEREELLFKHVFIEHKPRKELAATLGITQTKLNSEFERLARNFAWRVSHLKEKASDDEKEKAFMLAVIKRDHEVVKMARIIDFGWILQQISVRPLNALYNADIHTIGDLTNKTEKELLTLRQFGNTSLKEVESLLDYLGLSLKK